MTASTARPPHLSVGIIITALQDQIKAIEALPKGSPEYGNNLWRVGQLEEQIEALKYRPSATDLAGWGGEWLGLIRTWMQSNARNGSNVTWGSHEPLHMTTALTPHVLEQLAARIASAAVTDHMGTYVHRVPKVNGHAPVPGRKKSHYDWLDQHLVTFLAAVFKNTERGILLRSNAELAAEGCKGMISAHGDKCYQYRETWKASGIPFPHGVAVYLLSYIPPWSSTCRQVGSGWVEPKQWVVDQYPALKQYLPDLTEAHEQ